MFVFDCHHRMRLTSKQASAITSPANKEKRLQLNHHDYGITTQMAEVVPYLHGICPLSALYQPICGPPSGPEQIRPFIYLHTVLLSIGDPEGWTGPSNL